MICFYNLDLFMCHVLWCVMSFWQPQLLLVMCQPFDFGVQAFASNWSLRQASEAVSACNFLGQPTLFMCQTSFISTRVNKSGPGIGSQWILKHLQTLARSERPRKKGLGGFSSDLKPDLFPPWKRLSYEWNFGVRKCLWSPKFPTSNMVVNSYTQPVMHVRICK